MHIRRLQIVNVGPHRELDLYLNNSLVGITGPNGSGKSSIVNAVYFALTGSADRFDGVKLDSVNDAAPADAPAYVLAEVEQAGVSYVIHRGLRPNAQWLRVAGGDKVTRTADIAAVLADRLGVHRTLLDRYVVVAQGQLAAFLSDAPGDRAESFQALCGTGKARQIVAAVDKLFERRPELARPPPVMDLDGLRSGLAAKHKELADARAAAEAAAAGGLTPEKLARARQIAADQERAHRLAVDLAAAEAQAAGLRKTADASAAELAAVGDPPPGADPAEQRRTVSALALAARDRDEAVKVLATFDCEGVVACPTCGTPAANLSDYLKAQRDRVVTARAAVRTLNATLVAMKELDDHRGLHLRRRAVVENKAVADRVHAEAAERRRDELASHQRSAVSDDLYARAKAAIARHEQAAVRVAAADATVKVLARAVAEAEASLAAAEAVAARAAATAAAAERLRAVKAVFHRQALPQVVAQANLAATVADVNRHLRLFGGPFWVEAGEDLSFLVHFPGARKPRAAGRLSGGQRAVLGFSFRQAIASRFAADLGLQILDEPTADLDIENRRYLADALTKYADSVRGRSQTLVVTHCTELDPAFDQRIELKGA